MNDLRCQLQEPRQVYPLGPFCPVTSPVFSASFPVSLHHPCRLLHQASLGPCPSGTNTDGTEFCGRKSSQSCFSWHCFVLYRGLNWAFKGPSNSSELLLQFPLLPGSGLSDPNNRTHTGRQLRQELRLRPWSAESLALAATLFSIPCCSNGRSGLLLPTAHPSLFPFCDLGFVFSHLSRDFSLLIISSDCSHLHTVPLRLILNRYRWVQAFLKNRLTGEPPYSSPIPLQLSPSTYIHNQIFFFLICI